jgi:hypothetical protein
MQKIYRTAGFALVLVLAASAATAQERIAQNANTPPGASSMTPQPDTSGRAPVVNDGQRQPTQSSLPSSVKREEAHAARKPVDPLGPLPKICKDC